MALSWPTTPASTPRCSPRQRLGCLAGNGIPVALTAAPTPTPVFAHEIVHRQAGGGIMLTASHNPFDYQGYKVRSEYGGATPPEELDAIEEVLSTLHPRDVHSLTVTQAEQQGLCVQFDAAPRVPGAHRPVG